MEQLSFDDLASELERWLPVAGYEGRYEVSDRGRVRSLDRLSGRGHRIKGRILKQTIRGAYAHRQVGLYDGSGDEHQSRLVHTLVMEAFVGPPPPGMNCLHGPNGPSDNSLANLSHGTHAQNMADKVRDGTGAWGSRSPNAKLDEGKVAEILSLYSAGGVSHKTLGEMFGVSETAIRNIVIGRTWKHCSAERHAA